MGIAPALTRYATDRRSGAASSATAAQPRLRSGRARKRRRVRWPERLGDAVALLLGEHDAVELVEERDVLIEDGAVDPERLRPLAERAQGNGVGRMGVDDAGDVGA